MDNFTNETLDTKQLPKYEEVQLALLHPNYKKVVYLNSTIITAIIAIGFALLYMQNSHAFSSNSWMLFALGTALFCVLIYVFSILSFKKKGFAFRQHDVIYRSGKLTPHYIKRFAVPGVTRDREYDLTRGKPGSRIVYFSANPNGEAETVKVYLKPKPRLRIITFEKDFS